MHMIEEYARRTTAARTCWSSGSTARRAPDRGIAARPGPDCYEWPMRLFVAIALPAGAAGELDNAVAPLRLAWPELRWTGRDAWHLTLTFLGEVDEGLTRKLGVRLERAAARHARLSLSLGGAGAFPTAGRARVLWTGVQGDRRGPVAYTHLTLPTNSRG
jgi:hypothetical protein